MNWKTLLHRVPPRWRHPALLALVGVAVIVGLALLASLPGSDTNNTAYHVVRRGDFTVSVVEPGTLAAVSEVVIRSDVEGTARIISIVPEGTYVRKGDLLVELDSAQAQDQVNQQLINVEKARFAVTNAVAQLEIARSATNSDYLAAELKLRFARIDQDKYLKGQRQVDLIEASNKLVQAQAQLAVNLQTFHFTTNLAAKGYETQQKVDADGLAVTNTRNSLIVASNTIYMLETFDIPKLTNQHAADILQAGQELDRVVNQNKRKMDQYFADLNAQINTLKLSEDKLQRDRRNLTNTIIRAPQDGLVVYQVSENRFSSESLVEGGAVVRNRQELIKLPDLSRMKVTVKVHESHINMIRPGLPAYVKLQPMPDQRFSAVVERVAPLPDTQARWGNPNLKVYNTDVFITDPLPDVKPGISAEAEIVVTNIANILSIPIQSVTTLKGKQVVYLVNGHKTEPQPVEVGMYNTKFIEIIKGLKEGDRVLLSPPLDTQESDTDTAAPDARDRQSQTNRPSPTPTTLNPSPAPTPTNLAATPQPHPGRVDGSSPATGPGQGEGRRRRGGQMPAEMLKEFDKDGDGQLNDEERQAMQETMRQRFGGGAGGGPGMGGPDREAMMKRFDANGDGELDDTERAAMREQMGRNRPGRTNAPAGGALEGQAPPPGRGE